MLPCETMVMNDTRLINAHRPYSRPLGPGSYNTDVFGSESMGTGGVEKPNQLPPHRDPARPSPCFTSVSRGRSQAHSVTMTDSFNDTGGPDYAHWHRKGLYQSQTPKGVNPATWGPEPRVSRNPYDLPDRHDDSGIDCRGKHATIDAIVSSSNRLQCGSFDSGLPRTVPLPNGRTVRVGNVAKRPCPLPEYSVEDYSTSQAFPNMEYGGPSQGHSGISSLMRGHRQEPPNPTWKVESFSKFFRRMHNSNPKDHIRVQMDLRKAREEHQATLQMR
ncbi:hypothetical protein BSKO_04035 [Bryopsis sp. KO-2023]|nr:hypothetical protein BSKO_04035 [Bryopsis sp. KO-2023]